MSNKNEWSMPPWMEKYRDCFNNTGGNSIEDLMNREVNPQVNLPVWVLKVAVESQVNFLLKLHKDGLLAATVE